MSEDASSSSRSHTSSSRLDSILLNTIRAVVKKAVVSIIAQIQFQDRDSQSSSDSSDSQESQDELDFQAFNNEIDNNIFSQSNRFVSRDVEFFDSFYDDKFCDTDLVMKHAEKNTYIRNIHVFIDRLKDVAKVKILVMIRNNLQLCLRDSALK